MDVPNSINKLFGPLHQDWELDYGTFEKAVAACVRNLNRDEQVLALDFFNMILDGRYTDNQLAEIWNKRIPEAAGVFDIKSGAFWFFDQFRSKLNDTLHRNRSSNQ